MSVSSYINSLNSGNIAKIKKGRSFSSGGAVGRTMSREERQKFRSGGYRNQATSQEKQTMIGKIEQTISSGQS